MVYEQKWCNKDYEKFKLKWKKGIIIIFLFYIKNEWNNFYERNKDVILNRAKDYYKNDKEWLRDNARDKYINLSEEKKIENMEETDMIIRLKKKRNTN